jgi:O-acetyl-ADP-ribose deacetylase (regulator of RNase III)
MSRIHYLQGDATHPIGVGPSIIVHCCNDIGVWGAGFVLALSKRWSDPEREYRAWAREFKDAYIPLGGVRFVDVGEDIAVANLIGQTGVGFFAGRPPVRYPALAHGFKLVATEALRRGATVHMPRIGCGLAGGMWEKVEPLILEHLCARGVTVCVYDFAPTPSPRRLAVAC